MSALRLLLIFSLTGPFLPGVEGSAWWYFTQFDTLAVNEHHKNFCKVVPHLNKRQREICNKNSDLVRVIGDGVKDGVSECQYQFRYQKWNCSTFRNDPTLFGKSLVRGGSRESALLQAMHSSSAIYKLAKACSKGHPGCGCSTEISNGQIRNASRYDARFKWDGCDQVVKFSTNFVRRFIDAAELRVSDAKAKFNLHNNRVGRIIVRKKLKKVCKCHGLSGSCSMRTCWSTLPSFREIGDALRGKYDAGVEVIFTPSGSNVIPVRAGHRKLTKVNLIFYDMSPDYCRPNFGQGSVGTKGRPCLDASDGEESCDILCCRQKYEIVKVRYSQRCNCTFTWCCQVSCQTCNGTRFQYSCKY
ncbi:protein Wnt-2b [Folsomia candida]|uniref:protein Wnt-2b n=1 Tax=Folsomia candida TaxID=158441 RepID=UPI001604A48D|nr:protein Wnt-2b [Folsomia candida]